jgi:NADPH:quinone reductase-like Zn-dependent oxidoreductase
VGSDNEGRNYFVFAEGVGGGFASGGTHASEYSFPENILYPLPDASKNSEIAAPIISLVTVLSVFKDIAKAKSLHPKWVGEEWIEKGIQCFCSEYPAKDEKHG